MVHAEVSASCLGCDASALFRPADARGPTAGRHAAWSAARSPCPSSPTSGPIRCAPHLGQCGHHLRFCTAEPRPSAHGDGGGIIDQLYDLCAVDRSGVRAPYEGDWGTCSLDGTLSAGQSCELACDDRSVELHGTQPFCAPGGHLMAAGSTSQPWEAGSADARTGTTIAWSATTLPATPATRAFREKLR